MKTKYNVKLLNGSKQEVTYEGVETVTLPDADSDGVKQFTAGEPLDDFTVTPDFSEGDQTVEAPEGTVIRSGTITKPEGAEAVIAKGETLMGMPGEYVTPGTSKTVELDFSAAGGETVVLEETTVEFAYSEDNGGSAATVEAPAAASAIWVGETYIVTWDGTPYECEGQNIGDYAVGLGDLSLFGGSGNQEPFGLMAVAGEGFEAGCFTDTSDTSHTFSITHGSPAVQTVTAEGDERWNEVVITKPENLLPENIAKDVEIAGVVGSFDAVSMQAIAERTISGAIKGDATTTVGSYAFMGTQVEAVSLPNCTTVGSCAFSGCSALSYATLPLCSTVYNYAFYLASGLESITLGCGSEFYTTIYSATFRNCSALETIAYQYSGSAVDGMVYMGDNDGASTSPGYHFAGCQNLKSIHIIGKHTAEGGLDLWRCAIPHHAFQSCYALTSVSITGVLGGWHAEQSALLTNPDVGIYAFEGCSQLSSITLKLSAGAGLAIGSSAFANCINLQHLWIYVHEPPLSGASYCSLGTSAFYNTPLSNSTLTGTYGTIHVPSAIYSMLRTAYGWSAYSARMVSY